MVLEYRFYLLSDTSVVLRMELREDDIPGASLRGCEPSKLKIPELKRCLAWLASHLNLYIHCTNLHITYDINVQKTIHRVGARSYLKQTMQKRFDQLDQSNGMVYPCQIYGSS